LGAGGLQDEPNLVFLLTITNPVLRQTYIRGRELDYSGRMVERMTTIILSLFRFVRLLGSGHQAIAVENLALRLQIRVTLLLIECRR
jgi:hypothetical protein